MVRLNRRIALALICLVFPVYVSDERFKDCIDLWLITDNNKSHYFYIKDFKRCNCHKTKNKNKKHFCRFCLQYFFNERVLVEHKEVCLKITGKQSINGSIKFNFFLSNQPCGLKFMLVLNLFEKGFRVTIKIVMSLIPKDIKNIFLVVLFIKLCVLARFSKAVVFYTG